MPLQVYVCMYVCMFAIQRSRQNIPIAGYCLKQAITSKTMATILVCGTVVWFWGDIYPRPKIERKMWNNEWCAAVKLNRPSDVCPHVQTYNHPAHQEHTPYKELGVGMGVVLQ